MASKEDITTQLIKKLHAEVLRLRQDNEEIKKRLAALESAEPADPSSASSSTSQSLALVQNKIIARAATDASKMVMEKITPQLRKMAVAVQYAVGDNDDTIMDYRKSLMSDMNMEAITDGGFGVADVRTFFD